jgi:uroporphyrinogen decarboxylase
MNSRERILTTLEHREPDRIPFDIAGTTWTGIAGKAYQNLLRQLGLPTEDPEWADTVQQIVVPSDKVLRILQADTRGLLPLTSHNWDVWKKLQDAGDVWEYNDEWKFIHHFPKQEGNWFSLVKHPMEHLSFPGAEDINRFEWPAAGERRRIAGLYKQAVTHLNDDKIVILKGLCAGIFEMHQRIRGMTNALLEPFIHPEFSDLLAGKIADLKIEFWDMALNELADVVDIIAEGDDFGTQDSQLIDPGQFRLCYKKHTARVLRFIREKAPRAKIMFHSCGNVRPLIADFIEMGVDILNPVHINAAGMEPVQLKKDFGRDIVFWGGGIDTQRVLPTGSLQEISADVSKNIDALAPGGGFVFATVHNIQGEVPPQNILRMWQTLMEQGIY